VPRAGRPHRGADEDGRLEEIERAIGDAERGAARGRRVGARALDAVSAAGLPSRKIGDFFRAPIAPYRPRLSFVRGYRIEATRQRVAGARPAADRPDARGRPRPAPVPDPGGAAEHPLLVARLAEDAPERVVAELTANYTGLLVLTDLFYPGGSRRRTEAAADPARGRLVPRGGAAAGAHRVVFRYRPLAFYAGAAVSAPRSSSC
jgi:hypothetical protein